jgi:uncharacterized protein YigE (DUF2233 family)
MKAALFLILFFLSSVGFTQVQEKQNFPYLQNNYDLVIMQVDSNLLKQASIVSNNQLSTGALIDSLNQTGNHYLAFNAAPTDGWGNLLGLFIKNGQLKQPLNTASGNGNFFLKPNGFWGLGKSSVTIRNSDFFNNTSSFYQAVQSGPMLLIDGKINPVFDPKSANKNIRIGIGTFSKNKIDFILVVRSQAPVTFYDFASLFKDKFNCLNALYLDGGDQSLLIMPSKIFRASTSSTVSQLLVFKIT